MIKKYTRIFLQKLGYKISKIQPKEAADNTPAVSYGDPFLIHQDPLDDMYRLLKNKSKPLIFDVGANIGQTIDKFLARFPESEIYSFEPGPETFLKLSTNHNLKNVHLENIAMGSTVGKKEFSQNTHPAMSSFLDIDRSGWGKIENKVMVDTMSVDHYCQLNGITRIDILKSDTQGFELEVLKGALQMMSSNNIHLVYFEFIFSDMYKDLPGFHEVYKLLSDNNFRLVKFYDFNYQEGMLSWADVLFVNTAYAG